MDFELILAAILFSVMIIAASSIGIKFYNNCKDLKDNDKMKNNYYYLIAVLVISILFAMFFMYKGGTHNVTKNLSKKYSPSFQF